MANELQNNNVHIYIDDTAAVDALERLQGKAGGLSTKIDEARKKQQQLTEAIKKAKDSGNSYAHLEKELKKVNTELGKNEKTLKGVNDQQRELQKQIDSKAGSSLKQQQALVTRLTHEYKLLGNNTQEAAQKLEELGRASVVLDQMKGRLHAVKNAQQEVAAQNPFSRVLDYAKGTLLGGLMANVVAQFSGFLSDSIDEALSADESTRRLENTLENLGRSDVFDRITAKADEVAEHFKYLDNDDVVGVFNKLIDYGKLTEKQMNDLIPVIVDFAAKQRISLEESSSVIIKALEGNSKSLREYGISIKESSSEAERMNVIMTTLKEKVDGAGEAFMNSAKGGIATARQEFANIKEELGNNLIPVLGTLMGWVNKVVIGLGYLGNSAKEAFGDLVHLFDSKFFSDKERDKRFALDKKAADEAVAQFVGKDAKAIDAEIDRINTLLEAQRKTYAAQQRLVKVGAASREDVKSTASAINTLKHELEGLEKLKQKGGGVLGLGGVTVGDKPDKPDKPKKDKKADQAKKDQEDLANYLRQKAFELEQFDLTEREKELNRAYQTYQEKQKLAHGNKEELKRLEELYWIEVTQIQVKYGRMDLAEMEKRQKERQKKLDELVKSSMAAARLQLSTLEDSLSKGQAKQARNKLAGLELQVLKSNGKKRLNAELSLLKEEEVQALQNKELTENEKLKIEEEYRQKRFQAEISFYINLVQQILNVVQQISQIAALDNDAKTNRENAELARMQKRNDKEKASYQKLLNNKLISHQEYNSRVKDLDDQYKAQEAAAKKKQWERQQKADVSAAIISGAQAVLSALQTKPFWLGLALSVVAAYKTKKEIDVIKSRPVPEFAKGGLLNGPSHAQGGMPVINPVTGKKEAEVEGGEVILSKKTVRNNPDLVGALLHSSMHRKGASIQPWYKTRTYQSIDYDGLHKSVQRVRFFENGGILPTAGLAASSGQPAQQVVVPAITEEQEALMQAMLSYLQQTPKAYVVYGEFEAQGDKLNHIRSEAIFK